MQHVSPAKLPRRVFAKPGVNHVVLVEFVRDLLWAIDNGLVKVEMPDSAFIQTVRQQVAKIEAQEDAQ